MVPLDDQVEEQKNWDYCTRPRRKPMTKFSAKGSQFEAAPVEFSGACPAAARPRYVKLLTQLSATGCTLPTPPAASGCGLLRPTFPQAVNARGFRPGILQLLFENNAEFAWASALSQQLRQQMKTRARLPGLRPRLSEPPKPLLSSGWPRATTTTRPSPCPTRS